MRPFEVGKSDVDTGSVGQRARSVPKVFCIGFQKTGTCSLNRALTTLGYRVCSARYDLIRAVRKGDLNSVFDIVDQYDAFEDNPWPLLFRDLDRAYPGSKFILTTRDEGRWIRSMVNHLGVAPDRLQRLVYGHGAPAGFEDVFLSRYRRHHVEVLQHFAHRDSGLLVVNWETGDGWPELCSFLKHEQPLIPFPHENQRSYGGWYSRFKFAAAEVIRRGRQLTGRVGPERS